MSSAAQIPHPSPANEPLLSLRGLSKRFPVKRDLFGRPQSWLSAVDDVDLDIYPGETVAVVGESGSGKSTLARLVLRLIEPTSGSALVAGIPLVPENGVEIRQRISVMPENPGLYLRLTVEENLRFFAGLYGLRRPDGQRLRR